MKKTLDNIIKYRYLFLVIVFAFCVILKLHGSSIGIYEKIIVNRLYPARQTELLGKSRTIRSDEWVVHTPYYFSQYYNNYNKYSHKMSYSGQNMILGYNAPVKDITLIGKPFTWGYLLFGNSYGLSWYWCLKFLLLIMVSFEFMLILTKKDRKMSLFGAFLLAFSPTFHWWFVPHITDVFFWALTVIVLTYHFFLANTKFRKIIFTILLPCSFIGYALALFPSCQVPLAFISLALIVAFLVRDKKDISFTKKDIFRIIFVLFVSGFVLFNFIVSSIDDLKLLMNTVYPGSRISTGNDKIFKDIFTDLTTVFLPYKDITYLNNCEACTFIHLAPVFLILYKDLFKCSRKNAIIGKIMFVIIIIELFFMLIGFPEILAKITFFSYINRMNLIYGFSALLFTIWSIYTIYKYKVNFSLKKIFTILFIFAFSYLITINKEQLEYLPIYVYVFEIIYLCIMVYGFLRRKKVLPFIMFILLIAFSSLTINPISRGTNSITNHKTSRVILKESKKNDGYWVSEGSFVYSNYLLASGAKVMNATNFYPDYGKWKLIDKKGKNDYFYNRYANMSLDLTKEKTEFKLAGDDHLYIKLSYNDLDKLNIKYIFTERNIENDLNDENIKYDVIYHDNQFNIYKLK